MGICGKSCIISGGKYCQRDYPHRESDLTFCHFQEKWDKVINKIPPLYIPKTNYYISKKRFNMYLNEFNTTVTQSLHTVGQMTGTTYIVDYGLGECVYTYQRIGKRIKQEVLQLIKCDMWKVIAVINEETPLNEGDMNSLNMEIRNHSLNEVTKFINGRGLHQ